MRRECDEYERRDNRSISLHFASARFRMTKKEKYSLSHMQRDCVTLCVERTESQLTFVIGYSPSGWPLTPVKHRQNTDLTSPALHCSSNRTR